LLAFSFDFGYAQLIIQPNGFLMELQFSLLLVLIVAGSAVTMFAARMRMLSFHNQPKTTLPDADRYRPMLRLLSDADMDFAAKSPILRKKMRTRRREMFRGYLRCLTRDYVGLLSSLRRIMVESDVDRPDLAKALAKNRAMFALALCRIEIHLQLHALGIGKVDVSGLVGALDALRGAVSVMTPATGSAY
jgi:hypothetical protein